MKIKRLLGGTLIMSSLLLPIGYAASFPTPIAVANNELYEARFETIDFELLGEEQYISVMKGASSSNSVHFSISNLYPGAGFKMKPIIRNYGSEAIKISEIVLEYIGGDEEFFNLLQGYDETGKVLGMGDYNQYLTQQVQGKVLKANETTELALIMELSPTITELKESEMEFRLSIAFEQAEADPTPTPTSTPNSPPESTTTPTSTPTSTPQGTTTPTEVVPEETVPGGTATEVVPEEEVPGGKVVEQPKLEIIPDEQVPAGATEDAHVTKGELPKTGGIGAGIIYAVATGLLGTGIFLCRKKENK